MNNNGALLTLDRLQESQWMRLSRLVCRILRDTGVRQTAHRGHDH
jgi:hypothetical protein